MDAEQSGEKTLDKVSMRSRSTSCVEDDIVLSDEAPTPMPFKVIDVYEFVSCQRFHPFIAGEYWAS